MMSKIHSGKVKSNKMIKIIENRPEKSNFHLILAWAGALMDSEWMNELTDRLCREKNPCIQV